jgi:acetyl esterase/lipase
MFLRFVSVTLMAAVSSLGAAARVDSNVVYGMYSGLALLMDVHHPERPKGLGIVFVSGSGWHAPLAMGAPQLKIGSAVETYAAALTRAGYTVFAVNHRAAPRFHYPAPVEDVQRAVRFIRYHAKEYGIDPARMGAAGGSSGGHLVEMLGVLDGKGDDSDPDPVNRVSAKVQCVAARAAPADMGRMARTMTAGTITSFMGMPPDPRGEGSVESRTYLEASPIHHVSAGDAPMLLLHGDRDATVPLEQSELMEKALQKAGVDSKLFVIPGGAHGPTFGNPKNPPDYLGEMVRWFESHL